MSREGDWKREDRRRRGESKNSGCEIDSSYRSEIEGFFFSCKKLRVDGGIWNSFGGSPSCKQQYWFPETWSNYGTAGFVPANQWPLKDQTDSGGAEFWASPNFASSPPLRAADCFCHQSHREKVKEIESAVSTVSRVSLRTRLQDGRFPLLAVPVKRFTGITT